MVKYKWNKISPDYELVKIYLERENWYKQKINEGLSWDEVHKMEEEMDFQTRIDKVVYPSGKKKEYEYTVGDVLLIYAIVGSNFNTGGKYSFKKSDSTINGKVVYNRIFIKRVGFAVYLGQDLWDYYFEVNEDVKDVNEAVNLLNNNALVCARINKGEV